jgi:hypothetical protein
LGREVGFVFREIKMVHRGWKAAKGHHHDSVCGILKRFINGRFLLWKELSEDVIAERGKLRGSDTEAEPGEILGAETADYGFEAILAPGGTREPDAEAAEGEGDIIADDEDFGGFETEEAADGSDRDAAEIHESLGLEEQQGTGAREVTIEALFHGPCGPEACGQAVEDHESGIVARLFVFASGIAETGDEADGGGFLHHRHGKIGFALPESQRC